MKKVKISDYAIDEIVSYLKKRLELTHELNCIRENSVPYDSYMVLYNKYKELIRIEDEKEKNGVPVSTLEKDGQTYTMRSVYVSSINDIKFSKAENVIFPEGGIDEICELVRKGLSTYGITTDEICSENFFIRGVLRELRDNMDPSNEEYKKVEDLVNFFYSTEDAGINVNMSGRIKVRLDGSIQITNQDYDVVFKTGSNGDKLSGYVPVKDNVLLSNRIIVGYIITDGDPITTLLLKNLENDTVNAFIYDKKDYEVGLDEVGKASLIVSLKPFLYSKGLEFLYKDVYSFFGIKDLVDIFNRQVEIDDDYMNRINEITNIVCDWWAKAIECPKFDMGDDSPVGGMTMALAMMFHVHKPPLSEKDIERFKSALAKQVKICLLSSNYVSLDVDYGPCRILSEAASDARISPDFPWKTCTLISLDEVKVSCGYGAPYETLYEAKKEDEDLVKLAKENNENKDNKKMD